MKTFVASSLRISRIHALKPRQRRKRERASTKGQFRIHLNAYGVERKGKRRGTRKTEPRKRSKEFGAFRTQQCLQVAAGVMTSATAFVKRQVSEVSSWPYRRHLQFTFNFTAEFFAKQCHAPLCTVINHIHAHNCILYNISHTYKYLVRTVKTL